MNEQLPKADLPHHNSFVRFLGRLARDIREAAVIVSSELDPDDRRALAVQDGIQELEDYANGEESTARRLLRALGYAAQKTGEGWAAALGYAPVSNKLSGPDSNHRRHA